MLSIEGNVINTEGTGRSRVEIGDDGLIASVGKETGSADVVLDDELIFPGFIDIHVHARECMDHSWDYKEDFTTAGWAAIGGGVVAFADMPNNPVAPVDEKSYADKFQLAKKSAVDVVLYAGIGPGTEPLSDIGADTIRPYKVFMGPSIGALFFKSADELESAISKYSGQSVSFHCEDPAILQDNKNQATHESRRPATAELSAIEFALSLIKKYSLSGKLCHISTATGVQKIAEAKKSGINVVTEASPHHLFYDESNITEANYKFMQTNPPLRSRADRLALIEGLKNGTIDFLATDHAPHTVKEKERGTSGTPQLDTYGNIAAWLIKEHNFTTSDIVRVCSLNPGRWLNQFVSIKFGEIKEGFAGSLTVLDMNRSIKIEKPMLKTKCGWSPFEGVTFPGRVACTVIRGKVFSR
jgi:dihydroorotase